eukprot:9858308-Lingulodinium_polyedra.AAC.1
MCRRLSYSSGRWIVCRGGVQPFRQPHAAADHSEQVRFEAQHAPRGPGVRRAGHSLPGDPWRLDRSVHD